jgi:hypothetical protein
VSRSLKSVGPNATLVQNDVGTVLRELKARLVGEIDVAGPDLVRSLTDLGLVDEYRAGTWVGRGGCREIERGSLEERCPSYGGPTVRIRLPPAASPRLPLAKIVP